jgi:hypothetical protein
VSVESIQDQFTRAVLRNPYSASWASHSSSPVSLQPTEGAKTANSGASDPSGLYVDSTLALAHAALIALNAPSTGLTNSSALASNAAANPATYKNQNPVANTVQSLVQTQTSFDNALGTFSHAPLSNSGVNPTLSSNSINNLPEFQSFMRQMFITLNSVDQQPSASQSINELNKNSQTASSKAFSNYYKNGYDQNSYDLLSSKLKYLAARVAAQPSEPALVTTITPGQSSPEYAKDNVLQKASNTDNQVTNPNIDKLQTSYNSLVSSLQGNVANSSLASFIQNLQHQAHGFSSGANLVNTSA